jgi:hypothetical protein
MCQICYMLEGSSRKRTGKQERQGQRYFHLGRNLETYDVFFEQCLKRKNNQSLTQLKCDKMVILNLILNDYNNYISMP